MRILILIPVAIGIVLFAHNEINTDEELNFYIWRQPTNTDPIDFDLGVHHEVMRSVLGGLVSYHKKGEIKPFIAQSWVSSNDFKEWTFKIRDGLFFSDNSPIDSAAVYLSLKRIVFIINKSGSKSGISSLLSGCSSLKTLEDKCEGLSYNNNEVKFKFDKPFPSLLESLGFGLYSIVSKSNFDPVTGEWKDKEKVLSSSFYEISNWNDKQVILSLRNKFDISDTHQKKFKTVVFSTEGKKDADMYRGFSSESRDEKVYSFSSGAYTSIVYMKIVSYKLNPLLRDRETRKYIRDFIFSKVNSLGEKRTNSFIPKVVNGVFEPKIDVSKNFDKKLQGSLVISGIRKDNHFFADEFNNALLSLKEIGINVTINNEFTVADWQKAKNPDSDSFIFDMAVNTTGVAADKVLDDLKFMLFSKQGIALSDENDEIKNSISNGNENINDINQQIADQALNWVLWHPAEGYTFKKSYDLSLRNTLASGIDFAYIGIEN